MARSDVYWAFVVLLTDELHEIEIGCSFYDAVMLTVPDDAFRWRDVYNDPATHFLDGVREDIESADAAVFDVVVENTPWLIDRSWHSVFSVYTYRDFEYVELMFRKISGLNDDRVIYERLSELLRKLCDDAALADFFGVRAVDYLNNLRPADELNETELRHELNDLFVCLTKLFCGVIIFSAKGSLPKGFDIAPSMAELSNEYAGRLRTMETNLRNNPEKNVKLDLYRDLYSLICHGGLKGEIQNFIADRHYYKFFKLVNSEEIQQDFIGEDYDEIFELYKMFDNQMKYKLYRGGSSLSERDKGIMRYSLTERRIVLRYLKSREENPAAKENFERVSANNSAMSFVLRQAADSDFEAIRKLNNPPEPYRRAIFVKSDDIEIEEAIGNKEAFVVEEIVNGNSTLACVAIILDSARQHNDFNADRLCADYARDFERVNGRAPKFLDFDSVITNNGKSETGRKSYRGLAFQRLMLVLAEELAKRGDCDYVCATVSSFNAPSKRNFDLAGYEFIKNEKYEFTEEGDSGFWKWLQAQPEEIRQEYNEKIKKELEEVDERNRTGRAVLDELRIEEESYRLDKDVPRNFLVLKLK